MALRSVVLALLAVEGSGLLLGQHRTTSLTTASDHSVVSQATDAVLSLRGILRTSEFSSLTRPSVKFLQESQVPQEAETQLEKPIVWQDLVGVAMSVLIFAAFAKAYIMVRKVPEGVEGSGPTGQFNVEGSGPTGQFNDWQHPCWSCYEEPVTSLCGFCCFPIRWAETVSFLKSSVSFWPALLCMAVLVSCVRLTQNVGFVAELAIVVVCVAYRQEMRKRFEFKRQGGITYVTDCLMYLFCCVCAVIQEARHMEDALAQRHQATTCSKDRKRSSKRSECFTTRFFTKDGPIYDRAA